MNASLTDAHPAIHWVGALLSQEETALTPKEIPLFASQDDLDEPIALTDVVLALYLEGLPSHSHAGGEEVFDSQPLSDAVIGAFALGCAVGLEYPQRVPTIIEQTHPGAAEQIIEECKGPLTLQVAEARHSAEPMEPEDFVESLVEALGQGEHVDGDTAQNALSMSFEYGCVLAHVERSAAMIVRNAFNRDQETGVRDYESGESTDMPAGPDPYQSLQELAKEIVTAYEADIGFWP